VICPRDIAPSMQSDVETGKVARSRHVDELSSRLVDPVVSGSRPKGPIALVGTRALKA
jgi:hypothetical protein